MILDLDTKGYDIKKAPIPLYCQLALTGVFRGIFIQCQVANITQNNITVMAFVTNPNMLEKDATAFTCLVDKCNNATNKEQRARLQFGLNAVRYDYSLTIKGIKPLQNNEQFNAIIKLNIKGKQQNFCKVND